MTTCLLTTIILSMYSIHRYIKNEDTTSIKVTTFLSTKEAIYPSMTFCVFHPFLEKNFAAYGDMNINKTSYMDFLKGRKWNDSFLLVDYDNVTVSLKANLIDTNYDTHSSGGVGYMRDADFKWDADYHVSYRSVWEKCFTVHAPFPKTERVFYYEININNSIFSADEDFHDKFIFVYFHYPGQRYTSYYTIKDVLKAGETKNEDFSMIFEIRNIDVISRRNKIDVPCLEDWKNYDQIYAEKIIIDFGCHPPHWKWNSKLPICSSKKQMKYFSELSQFYDAEIGLQPCRKIDRLDYSYRELKYNMTGTRYTRNFLGNAML